MSFLQRPDGKNKKEENLSPEGKVLASMKNLSLRSNKESTETRTSDGTQVGQASATNISYDQKITNLSKGLRKFAIVPLPQKCSTGWISRHTGEVYLGEKACGNIHVVSTDRHLKCSLSLGPDYDDIYSGCELFGGHHLVVVHNKQTSLYELQHIKMDMNRIVNNNKINMKSPQTVFQYDDTHVGILCLNPERLEVYSKSDFQLSQTILVDLELSGASLFDVCKTREYIYISDDQAGVVHVVDDTGERVKAVGEMTETRYLNQPGKLYKPAGILCDDQGGLVVACVDGSYHRYISNQWEIAVKTKGIEDYLWYCMASNNILYTIYQDKLTMHKIRK